MMVWSDADLMVVEARRTSEGEGTQEKNINRATTIAFFVFMMLSHIESIKAHTCMGNIISRGWVVGFDAWASQERVC